MILKETIALLALPSHPCPRLPPCPSERLELLVHLSLTVRLGISRIACRPFGELCGFTGTAGAAQMLAVLADGGCSGDKERGALVAGASDALSGRLVDEFVAGAGADGQHALALGRLIGVLVGLLLLGRLLLGVARALFAAAVLALHTGAVGAVEGAAAVAAAVDTHANGLLDALDG